MPATFRPGTPDDGEALYGVFAETLAGVGRRGGAAEADVAWADPAFVAGFWARHRPVFDHLARTAERWWIAEQEGRAVGYARATLRDGVRQLTEFFVLPAHQVAGIGRELLARAFPAAGARRRVVVATSDPRAVARYLKAGVNVPVPIYPVTGRPRPVEVATDLAVEEVAASPGALAALRAVDEAVLGFARDADHAFLLGERRGALYRRGGQVVGYGYFGGGSGPVALLDPADVPAVLARAETEAAARGEAEFGIDVPLVNRAALDHLLGRGFRLGASAKFCMSDEPFGAFDRYALTTPSFFL
jgi:hypothetical protein